MKTKGSKSTHRSLAENVIHVYEQARTTEDGQRCMVAPHPDLNDKIKTEVASILSTRKDLQHPLSRMPEPQALGLNDGVILPPEEYPFGVSLQSVRNAAAERAPLAGVVRVIVVLVNFPDKHMSAAHTKAHFNDLFFSQGVIPTKSVREYYKDVTHGIIDIQGQVVGPFMMPQTLAAYAHGASGMGGVLPNARTMARDALTAADPVVNFAPYDNDGNGFVDAFIVIHAGSGAEMTGSTGDIWSHKWVLDGGAKTVDGTKVYGYLTVPEDSNIGVCCHELGHLLFGFPDLYDTDGTSEGIGNFCLMAAGSWGGGGNTPVHPCAWCKANQGWATVTNVMNNGPQSIEDVKTSHKVFRLWKNGAAGSEYFLVENRQKTGFDASLPGGGLLIWHIDEAQAGNTNENHYKVALIQADGKKDLEHNTNRGDAGDPYPGSSGNTGFNASSTPNSKSYLGQPTCVAVNSISAPAAVMTATLNVKCKITKEIIKEKEFKEIKEKEGKEIKEKEHKEFKEKDLVDKITDKLPKEAEKPATDKSVGLDKGFDKLTDGGKLTEGGHLGGGLGGGLGGSSEAILSSLLARVSALESQQSGGQHAAPQPFIGAQLRPDLSQSALLAEKDLAQIRQQMEAGSTHAKRAYDTKVNES